MMDDLRAQVHIEPPPVEIDDEGVNLDQETLLEMYWQLVRARRLDERSWVLHRQGKIAFHISGLGHEGIQVAAAFAVTFLLTSYFMPNCQANMNIGLSEMPDE